MTGHVSAHEAGAIEMAEKLKEVLRNGGCEFFLETATNQQFVILENKRMEELRKDVGFDFWEPYDAEHTVVRFATSWSTTEEDLVRLSELL